MAASLNLAHLSDGEVAELLLRLEQQAEHERALAELSESQRALVRERERLENSFLAFLEYAWPILEPGTTFSPSWHYELLAEYLTLVAQGKLHRLIINVPPRTAKSTFATIAFPVWLWTWQPEHRFMFASHSQRLSQQHSVKRRNLIESEWFQRLWGDRIKLSDDQNEKREFSNTRTGTMIATSVGGTVTGSGGNTLLLDDALSPDQARSQADTETCNEWIDNTWMSRFNDPATGSALIIEQRTSLKDPTGSRLLKEPGIWTQVVIPLVADTSEAYRFPISGRIHVREEGDVLLPARHTTAVVASIKSRRRTYTTQYQQKPSPPGGAIFQPEWWKYYDASNPPRMEAYTATWDMAFKETTESDYVVGQLWGRIGVKHYLLREVRRRMGFTTTAAEVVLMAARHPHPGRQLVEAKANGPAIVNALKAKVSGLTEVEPQGSKYARAEAASPDVESGNVHLPGPEEAPPPWVVEYIDEFTAFTGIDGGVDDRVDATSQYLNWSRRISNGVADYYAQVARDRENAAKESPLIPKAGISEWSPGIRILGMGIEPPEAIDLSELALWIEVCEQNGDRIRAGFAQEYAERLRKNLCAAS